MSINGRQRTVRLAAGLLIGILVHSVALAADAVRVRGGIHSEFSWIVFDWPSSVGYEAEISDDALVVSFERSGDFDSKRVLYALGHQIDRPVAAEDGRRITIPLKGSFELKHFPLGTKGGPRPLPKGPGRRSRTGEGSRRSPVRTSPG